MNLPTYESSERAARAVLNWLSDGEPRPHERLPNELIVRGTTPQPREAALQPTLA
jgi:LacI family transcriptional regulator